MSSLRAVTEYDVVLDRFTEMGSRSWKLSLSKKKALLNLPQSLCGTFSLSRLTGIRNCRAPKRVTLIDALILPPVLEENATKN